jgi:type VI protein secretion system component VasF
VSATDDLEHDIVDALNSVQRFQAAIDAKCWEVSDSASAKVRHISFHLTIAAGKMARIEERRDHGDLDDRLLREVAADLFIYALQLSELQDASLANLYRERIRSNIRRHTLPPTPD